MHLEMAGLSALALPLLILGSAVGQSRELTVLDLVHSSTLSGSTPPWPSVTLGVFPSSIGTLSHWKVAVHASMAWELNFQNYSSNIANIVIQESLRVQAYGFYTGGGSYIISDGASHYLPLFVLGSPSGPGCAFYRQHELAGLSIGASRNFPANAVSSGPITPLVVGNVLPFHVSGPIGWQYCNSIIDVAARFSMVAVFVPVDSWVPAAHHQDLGLGLAGSTAPRLMTAGLLAGGSRFYAYADRLPPNAPIVLVLGVGQGNVPMLGGTMVPSLQGASILSGRTGPDGDFSFSDNWPALPANTLVCAQVWTVDASSPSGFVATNGVGMTSQ